MRPGVKYFLFLALLLLWGCKENPPEPQNFFCVTCHQVALDAKHDFPCQRCHAGQTPAPSKEAAHKGLVTAPALPPYLEKTCGPCHRKEVTTLKKTRHFTLVGEINPVLKIFGLKSVDSVLALKEPTGVETLEDLVHDLLRRRCLRCHLFYEGDAYAETKRGRGCAACHLKYAAGELISHEFVRTPPDRLCLHCHYGNRVGFDYYGLFEHDYPYAFRSPLIEGEPPPRPWGVEYHEMNPDLHLKAGLACTDCHTGRELMAGAPGPRCQDCHPKLSPAYHKPSVLAGARCSACHAVWSFQDREYHLILHFDPDWEEWAEFYVQGSSEVEETFLLFFETGMAQARMRDKISGKVREGIWFLGFRARRFAEVPLGYDEKGRVSVLRPILDLHLSLAREDEIPFDNFYPEKLAKDPEKRFLPYAPHTIGAADYFRTQKVLRMIHDRSRGTK